MSHGQQLKPPLLAPAHIWDDRSIHTLVKHGEANLSKHFCILVALFPKRGMYQSRPCM